MKRQSPVRPRVRSMYEEVRGQKKSGCALQIAAAGVLLGLVSALLDKSRYR